MVVTNNGPDTDTNVKVSDPMPAGNTYVSSSTTQGTCTGGAILNCDLGTMAAGSQVTITLVTTPSAVGIQTNTATVSGDRPETNTGQQHGDRVGRGHAPFQQLPCVADLEDHAGPAGRRPQDDADDPPDAGAGKAAKGIKVRIKGAGHQRRHQGAPTPRASSSTP